MIIRSERNGVSVIGHLPWVATVPPVSTPGGSLADARADVNGSGFVNIESARRAGSFGSGCGC